MKEERLDHYKESYLKIKVKWPCLNPGFNKKKRIIGTSHLKSQSNSLGKTSNRLTSVDSVCRDLSYIRYILLYTEPHRTSSTQSLASSESLYNLMEAPLPFGSKRFLFIPLFLWLALHHTLSVLCRCLKGFQHVIVFWETKAQRLFGQLDQTLRASEKWTGF